MLRRRLPGTQDQQAYVVAQLLACELLKILLDVFERLRRTEAASRAQRRSESIAAVALYRTAGLDQPVGVQQQPIAGSKPLNARRAVERT